MVGTRCVSRQAARRSIDFTILFLIIGTVPLGIALDESGVAARIASWIVMLQRHFGEPGLVAGLFLHRAAG